MSYQEDAEAFEHQRELNAIEDDRRKNGIWGSPPLAPDEYPWIEEEKEQRDEDRQLP